MTGLFQKLADSCDQPAKLPAAIGICPECRWWVSWEDHRECPECDTPLVRFASLAAKEEGR